MTSKQILERISYYFCIPVKDLEKVFKEGEL